MTREEAIDLLDNLVGMVDDNQGNDYDTALKMAIKVLQMEPCEDAISRQKALDTVDNLKIVIANNLPELIYKSSVLKLLHELPSVQPEQKEITMEDVKAYCEPRNLVVLTKELFDQMNNTADKIYLYLKDRERR